MVTAYDFFAVRTVFLNVIYAIFGSKGLMEILIMGNNCYTVCPPFSYYVSDNYVYYKTVFLNWNLFKNISHITANLETTC
jgi:hypothetical protein